MGGQGTHTGRIQHGAGRCRRRVWGGPGIGRYIYLQPNGYGLDNVWTCFAHQPPMVWISAAHGLDLSSVSNSILSCRRPKSGWLQSTPLLRSIWTGEQYRDR